MQRSFLAGLVMAMFAAPASGEDGQKLSVTIYNSNLALVQDIRAQPIAAGRSRLEFKDVSALIRPETVSLAGDGLSIVEQNFDFDLLTPAKLMEKAVGKSVKIVRINPGDGREVAETATVLSVNQGVVLRIGDRVEVLREDDVPTRVIFDKVPENLRARPTLSVTVDSSRAGTRPTTLSYLTHGLAWKADYVALFEEKPGKLDLQGWVTLTNTSGVDYRDAQTQLVAGDVNLVNDMRGYWQRQQSRGEGVRRGGTEAASAGGPQSVADYYLYPLARPTTIAQNQTKQVSFLDVKGAQARKAYEYRASWFRSLETPAHADVALQFANSRAGGLGAQLPAGVVRVYVRDAAGEPKFVGENAIDHTPQGSDISVKIGEAFDVTVQPTVVAQERAGLLRSRFKMSYLVRNARSTPATVTIRQGGLGRDGKVLEENIKSTRIDAYRLSWDVTAPANGEATLAFTVDTGW